MSAQKPLFASAACKELRCGGCAHFINDPKAIENIFAGLNIMSSGHASVRAQDGLCELHGVYLSYRDTCRDFVADNHPQ